MRELDEEMLELYYNLKNDQRKTKTTEQKNKQ